MQGAYDQAALDSSESIVAKLSRFSLAIGGRTVLCDISIEFLKGKRYVITGPSGAGKSSLALTLAGLSGEIWGAELGGTFRSPRVPGSIVFQNPFLQMFHTNVYEEVLSSMRENSAGRKEVLEALENFSVADCIDRDVFSLSAGERKRVCLAAAFAADPEFLILDEPTGYLDREGIDALKRSLTRLEGRVTVVVFDHRTEPFIDGCERFILLSQGRQVLSCEPEEVRSSAGTLKKFGVRYPWKWEDLRITLTEGGEGGEGGETQADRGGAREPLLRARNVRARYWGKRVLEDIDFELFPGEIAALTGDNGSGKSTLAMVLAGVKGKFGGTLRRTRGLRTVMMFQCVSDQLICRNVTEEIRYGRPKGERGSRDEAELIAKLDLANLTSRSPRNLSIGEQHRTILAALLGTGPDIIILDEPALGADWAHIEDVFTCLRERAEGGAAVLVITHDDKIVCRYADRVVRMEKGRIAGDYTTRFTERNN